MPELDHIYDVDNDVNYTLKDETAHQAVSALELAINKRLCVYPGNVGGAQELPDLGWHNVVDLFGEAYLGVFDPTVDVVYLRLIFHPSPYFDYQYPIIIYAYNPDLQEDLYYHVYADPELTNELTITGDEVIDLLYLGSNGYFYLVGPQETDLSNYYTKIQTDALLANKADTSSLATVATTGDYDDLTDKPTLATVATSGSYNDLSNKPTIPAAQVNSDWNAVSGVAQILNKPNLATVATSGNYGDLSNTPDLSALPYLENIAKADEFNTSTGYSYLGYVKYNNKLYICISSAGSTPGSFDPTEWNEIKTGDLAGETARINLLAQNNKNRLDNLATVATTGDYDDLSNKPSIPAAQVNSDWNAISGVAEILNKPNLATVATSGLYSDLSGAPSLATVATSGDYDDLNGTPALATVATSGDYDDLTDKPTFKTINGTAITGTGNLATASKTDSTASATSSTSGTWATRASVAITPGLWLLVANCYWSSNVNGYRYSTIAPNAASETGGVGYMRTSATNGQVTNHSLAAVVSESTNKTYYLNMLQNSGSSLTIGGNFTAVKLA